MFSKDNYMIFMSYLFTFIFVLVAIGFITLFERKLLGYVQNRKGPNKVGFLGLFQPFSDAIKLFSKETFFNYLIIMFFFFISPVLGIIFMIFLWNNIFIVSVNFFVKFSVLVILSVFCLTVYPVIFSGWASASSYSMIGSVRGLAQAVSYEAVLFLIFFPILLISIVYSCKDENNNNICGWVLFLHTPLYAIWMVTILAELNRTPFDLIEGESELVSGFNTEYLSSLFAILFMAEYGMILFFSFITTILFTNFSPDSFEFFLFFSFNVFLMILFRGTYVRFRYDQLMFLCWKVFLPFLIIYTPLIAGFKISVIYILNIISTFSLAGSA